MSHPSAESINPMSTFSGGLADYLASGTFGGRRAGRATAMAHAVGDEPSMNVRHPLTSDWLGSLAGAGVGAGLGAGAGVLLTPRGEGAVPGGVVGGLAGAVLTSLLLANRRRSEMKGINEKFDATKKLDPKRPGYDGLDVAGGFGGSHRMGQIEALKAMTGGSTDRAGGAVTDVARTGLDLAGAVPVAGPALRLAGLGTGIGQGVSAMREEQNDPKIRRLKVAAVLSNILTKPLINPRLATALRPPAYMGALAGGAGTAAIVNGQQVAANNATQFPYTGETPRTPGTNPEDYGATEVRPVRTPLPAR